MKMKTTLNAYFVRNFGDVVEPYDVQKKEDAEETVEDVVDRKHLVMLYMENQVSKKNTKERT